MPLSFRYAGACRSVVAAAVLCAAAGALLRAQSRPAQLIHDALSQVTARNLDSAEALVQVALSPAAAASPEEQGAALVLQGVVAYYRGNDSATARAFDEALKRRPTLREERLFQLDSSLWVLWRRAQAGTLCHTSDVEALVFLGERDTVRAPELTRSPRLVTGPRIEYPELLRAQRIDGHVLAAVLLDTAGHVVRDSLRIIESSDPAFSREARRYLNRAIFTGAASGGQPVRACVLVPIDFRIKSP